MARNGTLFLVFFMFFSQLASFSTASRRYPAELPQVIDGAVFAGEIPVVVSNLVNGKEATVVGCDHFTAEDSSSTGGVYVTGKYGSLVLNVLPKGSVPGSGPSKRINDLKA